MGWLSQFFINPAVVIPGAALIAAPILIHLINRMRYRRVKFAAMEFLLQSHQRNRRKLLLEQLLLLLLRVVAVLALVALIARPFFDPSQLLVLQGQKTHHLVLVDDSGSMRDRWGETSAFASSLDVVRKIADQGARHAGTQTLTLLLLSHLDQPLFTQSNLDPAFRTELETKLENLRCSHRTFDLAAGLQAAAEQLKHPAASKNLHVISDFRGHDWGPASTLGGIVKQLSAEGVTVNLVKAVPERHANLAVTELSGNVHVAAANVPVRLTVAVQNFGERLAENTRLSILQDGQKLPLSIVVNKLEAGAETRREFDVVFPTSGKHEIRVVLPADALEADNVRYLAVDISEANPVLIISGDLSDGEADYLHDALAPEVGITGFAPLIEDVEFLRRQPLQQYQCIYLLNVPELPADALRILEDYVAAGGGLAWFMGPQVRPGFYNDKLYKNGAGLFPVPLGTVVELTADATNPAPDYDFEDHPVFRAFQGQDNPYVENVKVSRYFSLAKNTAPSANVRTIAQLRNKAPIFLEHQFGAGKIVTNLTTCGAAWNDWPRNPSYVLLQLELEKYLARNDRTLERRIVGEPIVLSLDPAVYRSQLEIRSPDAANVTRLTAAPQMLKPASAGADGASAAASGEGDVRLVENYRETDLPGVYAVVRFRQDESSETQLLAYNVPAEESDLSLATSDQIRARLGSDIPVRIQEFGNFDWIQGKQAGQEIRDLILFGLLGLLLLEQLLAMRLSFHPKTAGAQA